MFLQQIRSEVDNLDLIRHSTSQRPRLLLFRYSAIISMRLLPTGPWWLAHQPWCLLLCRRKEEGIRRVQPLLLRTVSRWCSPPFCFYPIGQNLIRGPVFIYRSLCPGKTPGFSIKKGENGYWCATNTFSPRAWWRPHNSSANVCLPDGSLCYSWWLTKRANVLFPNTSSKACIPHSYSLPQHPLHLFTS